MTERKPLFLDTDTGLVTETGGPNTIDLATMPWLEAVIWDLARCKLALRFVGVDPDQLDLDDVGALVGG